MKTAPSLLLGLLLLLFAPLARPAVAQDAPDPRAEGVHHFADVAPRTVTIQNPDGDVTVIDVPRGVVLSVTLEDPAAAPDGFDGRSRTITFDGPLVVEGHRDEARTFLVQIEAGTVQVAWPQQNPASTR